VKTLTYSLNKINPRQLAGIIILRPFDENALKNVTAFSWLSRHY
jgi:hypothetical protein